VSAPAQTRGRRPKRSVAPAPGDVFERTVDEGQRRLDRGWLQLCATGAVGGIDVGLGVLALFLVQRSTHDEVLSSLAFGTGFVALTLAQSELFTENFLVPIAAIAAGRARWVELARLWAVTLLFNLIGGWVITGLIVTGIPKLGPVAIKIGRFYPDIGFGFHALALAMLGGCVITLMTWMVHSTTSVPAQLVAAAVAAFLLAAGPLDHAIVVSLEMFAALHAGAPFGYASWLATVAWASLGNILGGVGLVTVLRLVQVGGRKIAEEREEVDPAAGLVVVQSDRD